MAAEALNALVGFFEKLVGESAWKRLGLLLAVVVGAVVLLWGYEAYTGNFRATRMQFAVEHLTKLSDPELRKNIKGDSELEKVHERMKTDLIRFVEGSEMELGLPETVVKALWAAFPWFLLLILFFLVSPVGEAKGAVAGLIVVATPFVLVTALLPTFGYPWINYAVIPFCQVAVLTVGIYLWQKLRKKPE
jgi:hypothetical protein